MATLGQTSYGKLRMKYANWLEDQIDILYIFSDEFKK